MHTLCMCAHVRTHTHAHMHPPFHPPMHTHIHRALDRGLGGRDEPKEQVMNTGKEQKMTNVRHNFNSCKKCEEKRSVVGMLLKGKRSHTLSDKIRQSIPLLGSRARETAETILFHVVPVDFK